MEATCRKSTAVKLETTVEQVHKSDQQASEHGKQALTSAKSVVKQETTESISHPTTVNMDHGDVLRTAESVAATEKSSTRTKKRKQSNVDVPHDEVVQEEDEDFDDFAYNLRPKRGRSYKIPKLSTTLSMDSILREQALLSQDTSLEPEQPEEYKETEDHALQFQERLPANLPEKERKHDMRELRKAKEKFPNHQLLSNGQYRVPGIATTLDVWQFVAAAKQISRENVRSKPRGGCLCCDMGMGKTLTMLTCIVNNKFNAAGKNTLVVVPNGSIGNQWIAEVKKHCDPAIMPRCFQFRATDRQFLKDPAIIKHANIVVTTYDELRKGAPTKEQFDAIEVMREEDESLEAIKKAVQEIYETCQNPLFKQQWHRVVLDEAHAIRNHRSQAAQAAFALKKKIGWLITGTPLTNDPAEIYPYWKFIGDPNSPSRGHFAEYYIGDDAALGRSRREKAVSEWMIKWTRDQKFLGQDMGKLPDGFGWVQRIQLSIEEVIIIDCVKAVFRRIFNEMIERKKKEQELISALEQGIDFANFQDYAGEVASAPDKAVDETGQGNPLSYIGRLRQAMSHCYMLEATFEKDFTIAELNDLREKLAAVKASSRVPVRLQLLPWKDRIIDASGEPAADDDVAQGEPDVLVAEPFGKGKIGGFFDFDKQLEALINHREKKEYKCVQCNKANNTRYTGQCGHLFCDDCMRKSSRKGKKLKCKTCEATFDYETSSRFWHLEHPSQGSCTDAESEVESESESQDENEEKSTRRGRRSNVTKKGAKKKLVKRGRDYLGFHPETQARFQRFLEITDDGPRVPLLSSSRLVAIKETVLRWQASAPDDKILIFTQFVTFGQIMGKMLKSEKMPFLYYFGDATSQARDRAMLEFHTNNEIKIMIISLNCGGQALNVTCANRAIICEPWWNEAAEEQAFGRIRRKGQEKNMHMMRIVVDDSIETDMLAGKFKKATAINSVLLGKKIQKANCDMHRLYSILGRPVYDGNDILRLETPDEDEAEPVKEEATVGNDA